MAKILFKKLKEEAIIPVLPEGASAFDIFSPSRVDLRSSLSYSVASNIAVSIPEGYVGIINPRSSMAVGKNIRVGARVIHPSHNGEIIINLHNDGKDLYEINVGDRLAQLTVIPVLLAYDVVSSFEKEEGPSIGSTGR